MSLPEGFKLIHRDAIPDNAMQDYRKIMAPRWFSSDLSAQLEYINLPGNPTCGSVTQNQCLIHEKEVKGTISVYSFKYLNNWTLKSLKGHNYDLQSIPNWLIESGYIGDNSITPDLEHQGLMTILVQEMIRRFPHAFMIGITGEKNIGMQRVFEKTGATINHQFPSFTRPRNPRGITGENATTALKHLPLYLNNRYPPVVHLFTNANNLLVCGAIGTSPNFPNETTSTYKANGQLFPNQIVGFINPELELIPAELDYIYGKIARFKYISLFQLRNRRIVDSTNLQSGYDQGWVTALYQ